MIDQATGARYAPSNVREELRIPAAGMASARRTATACASRGGQEICRFPFTFRRLLLRPILRSECVVVCQRRQVPALQGSYRGFARIHSYFPARCCNCSLSPCTCFCMVSFFASRGGQGVCAVPLNSRNLYKSHLKEFVNKQSPNLKEVVPIPSVI